MAKAIALPYWIVNILQELLSAGLDSTLNCTYVVFLSLYKEAKWQNYQKSVKFQRKSLTS